MALVEVLRVVFPAAKTAPAYACSRPGTFQRRADRRFPWYLPFLASLLVPFSKRARDCQLQLFFNLRLAVEAVLGAEPAAFVPAATS